MKTYKQMDEYQQRKVRMLEEKGVISWDEAVAMVNRNDIKVIGAALDAKRLREIAVFEGFFSADLPEMGARS